MYVSPTQLAEVPGALELAQVASDSHKAIVDADLMERTLRGGDRSGFTPEQIAEADEALARIVQVIGETDQFIDGFLRFRYPLPLASVPDILTVWARAIVRYRLHKDLQGDDRTNPIVRDYRDAVRFLTEVREGRFSLGAGDTAVTNDSLDARFSGDAPAFSRKQLGAFR